MQHVFATKQKPSEALDSILGMCGQRLSLGEIETVRRGEREEKAQCRELDDGDIEAWGALIAVL